MKITLTLGTWISHNNMLLSAARYWAARTGNHVEFRCKPGPEVPLATFVLEAGGRRAFIDYNDRYELLPVGETMDLYMKRSLRPEDEARGIVPIGFHFNYCHGLHRLLTRRGFLSRRNQTEIVRALDMFERTGWSHTGRRVPHMFTPPRDGGGRVLFYVRLWDPLRNKDAEEQERRYKMNTVRIEAVRALRKLGNTAAGIIAEDYAKKMCPDLLLSAEQTGSRGYHAELRRADIGIANEGLRGSPGWKIGEYVAGSKAVISNAIESVVPGFVAGSNYALFDDALEIPDVVSALRRDRSYVAMQEANWAYTRAHLHPDVYFQRLLDRIAA